MIALIELGKKAIYNLYGILRLQTAKRTKLEALLHTIAKLEATYLKLTTYRQKKLDL